MTKKEFSIPFGIMAEYFGAQPSEGLSMVYFEAFKDWSIDRWKKACQAVMNGRSYNGLPKIQEIIEAVTGKTEDRVAIAYQTLMETLRHHAYWDSVIFEDGAIGNAVQDLGGWLQVSEWTIEDWRFRRKEFEMLYQAHLKRGNTAPVHLIGAFEQDNAVKGLTDHVPKAHLITDKTKLAIEQRKRLT